MDIKQLEAESCIHCEHYIDKIFQCRISNDSDSIIIPVDTVKGCEFQSEKEWICSFKDSSIA